MASFQVQTNMLSLLHYQHRLYTSELEKSHQTLGKLYKELERIEVGLSDWKRRGQTRKYKKKLQWNRATTRSAVKGFEAQQVLLHNYLRQCNDLIASCSLQFFQSDLEPWTASPLSPTADPFAPGSPVPQAPWTAGPFEERAVWNRQGPQYWDLSMLREPRPPLTGTPDSGYQDSTGGMIIGANDTSALPVNSSSRSSVPSNRSSISEKDTLPELVAPSSPAKLGAEAPKSPHRRRYSENTIATIESRLAKASFQRTASETSVSKE